MHLRYTGLRVRNLDRSLRFYTKILGLRVVSRGDMSAAGAGVWVLLEDPRSHQRLELNWYPPRSPFATPYSPGEALDHVGFLVGHVSRGKFESVYRILIQRGARPTKVSPKETEGWSAYLKDPDGNWIEIFRRPTASEVRASRRERPPRRRRTT